MPKYSVKNGGPLSGEVTISGSKNAVLPLMAASLLTDEKCIINDTPDLKDVNVMCAILREIGGKLSFCKESNKLEVETKDIVYRGAKASLASRMRASILVLGPLLARTGKATIAVPGGCNIGKRPVDLHLKGFEAMGAKVVCVQEEGFDYIIAEADRLIGCDIYLDFPSVGATENLMMTAALAEGSTSIENAAEEPEIVDLANFLNKMGAKIRGAGTDTIKIEGVGKLHGTEHTVIPDRIETGTYMVAAAITRGRIKINNTVASHVKPITAKLKECGAKVEEGSNYIMVDAKDRYLHSTIIKTLPYPGFPTDMQSPFMALLATVEGKARVIETVFEDRYKHIDELKKMGADIGFDSEGYVVVTGVDQLRGADVKATDLRAGAALVLAGLAAAGTTIIDEIYYIQRGYERFVEKMKALGAVIEEVD